MDKLLANRLTLNAVLLATDEEAYDKEANSLVSALQKLPVQQLASREVLQALDPSTQTIPYLFSLAAAIDSVAASGKAAPRQLSAVLLPEGALWPYITQALLNFDPIQARYAGELLTKLVIVVVHGAEQTQNLIPAIQLLHHVILRLDETSSTFTSTHHSYIRLCLLAQAYGEALDILDRPIYHIPAAVSKQTEARSYRFKCSVHESSATYMTPQVGFTLRITSKGYLEYYLMGALCYMGAAQYSQALAFLEIVLAAPAQQNVASSVMVDAYKKWVFLNLLVNGFVPNPPRSASQTAIRHIRAVAKPYDCVVEAFKSKDRQRLQAEIEQGMDVWNEDFNYGLIVEVFNAHRKFAISRLSKTYAAIPVAEVARQTSTEPDNITETLEYLQNLIATGNLDATIISSQTSSSQILRFLPDSIAKSEDQVEQDLKEKVYELTSLMKHITEIEYRMELSREYIDFLRKLKKLRDDDKKDGIVTGKGKVAAVEDIDEDMMEEF